EDTYDSEDFVEDDDEQLQPQFESTFQPEEKIPVVETYQPVTQPVQEVVEEVEDEEEDYAIEIATPIPQPVVEEKPQYTVKNIQTPVKGGIQEGFDIVETKQLEEQQNKVHQYLEYQKPPIDLLNDEVIHVDNEGELRAEYTKRIVDKLAVYGILVEPVDPIVGPTITRYQFKVLSEKTRMGEFAKYSDDLKACLESQYDIIIKAPIPGTNLVGIEVPNKNRAMVVLRPILESPEFVNAKGELTFAIGKEISGKNIVTDLAPMPHLLVSGASGSGKSIALHNIVVSLMYKYSPEYLRFIMVDPKMVELSKYNGSPHMLIEKAITQTTDTLAALDYLIKEMEARYALLAEKGVSKISEYNKQIDPKYTQKLPYIVLIVEELADLMAVSKSQVEGKLVRLAQKARAAGIHLILATQRPSVDVVTGLIKANISCRMALNAASADDSRTMLGGGGAEKLLKRGDMLFINSNESPVPVRIQGAYLDNAEIKSLVDYLIQSNEVYYPEEVFNAIYAKPVEEEVEQSTGKKADAPKENMLDSYCKRCMRYWLEKNHGKASASSIQRSQNIGFNRAGKILDQLTDLGYIEAPLASESNTKPRKVLISIEQLDELFPDMEG
ncbi:MAG: DNA translocase FtsK, partial [Clostridia bacterium]|nr:DNA translocase FtsK [Clostridia bacterium]